ncbi:LpqB family beta-propeller domain-containing protein [Kineococcus sp. NUM-3379]
MRRPVVAAALVVLLAGAAGCGRLPDSGPVLSGPRLADDPGFGLLQVVPEGPLPEATPLEVVRGFLRAAGSVQDDHAVARSFLTERAALRWRPDAATTICVRTPTVTDLGRAGAGQPSDGGPPPSAAATVQVLLEGPVLARIDAQGRRAEQAPGVRLGQRLLLRAERGRWRIDELPDGVVVSASDASRTFRAFPLAFATPDGSQLVPEVRWFAYGSTTATKIVRELLRGPSPWLAPAVVSGAPARTRLRLGSVPVADGVASVELTEEVVDTTPQERRLLLSQLRASLLRVPGVLSVRVTAGGVALSAPSGPDVPTVRPPDDPRLLVLTEAGLARWDGAELTTVVSEQSGWAAAGAGTHPAVSPVGGPFAMLGVDGRRLLLQRPGSPPVQALAAAEPMLPPSVDRFGWVWTARGQELLAVPSAAPDAGAVPVQGPAGEPLTGLSRLRVSRDGTRALVVRTGPDGAPVVAVHGVQRDPTGRPVGLTGAGPVLAPGAVAVLDVSWLGADHSVLLVQRPGEEAPRPVVAQAGGPVQVLPPAPGAESVAAGEAERGVVVGTGDGRLLVRSGADWAPVPTAAGRHPVYPG